LIATPTITDCVIKRWATKKSGGSTKNGRDSAPKYLGVKRFGGEVVKPGVWIVRQRGKKFYPGDNTTLGKDFTICAADVGRVRFEVREETRRKFHHDPNNRVKVKKTYVHVAPFTWETQPSEKEMVRVGINPADVQRQIEQTELDMVKIWALDMQKELAVKEVAKARADNRAKVQEHMKKVATEKNAAFEEYIKQLHIKHGTEPKPKPQIFGPVRTTFNEFTKPLEKVW